MRGHRQIDHTADLALEVWAPSEEELLDEAARAVVEIMTEGALVPAGTTRTITLESLDREDRLVCWLNEVIFLAVNSGFILQSAELGLEGETGLSATLQGTDRVEGLLAGELKSVTYHDLFLASEDGGYRARFVVDV